jgi:hypothetical protein
MHCCTFGASTEDADQAAQGGDLVKRALGWPESLMGSLPSRVQAVQEELDVTRRQLNEEVQKMVALKATLYILSQNGALLEPTGAVMDSDDR